MFYSTVLSRAKSHCFQQDKNESTKITGKRNGSLGEASEATTEWMVVGARSPEKICETCQPAHKLPKCAE